MGEKAMGKRRDLVQFERDGVSFKAWQEYYINDKNLEYEDGELADENQLRRLDAYRAKAGLLTSIEIAKSRNYYGLSQKDFALLLGLGEVTVTRFETKMAQSSSIDSILRIPTDDPLTFHSMFEKNKSLLNKSKDQLDEIEKKIILAIEDDKTATRLAEELASTKYFSLRNKKELTGGKSLNFKKISTIDYLGCQKMKMTKTKLAKLLFYCDFHSYKAYGHGITGLAYENAQFGALPIGYNSILNSPQFTLTEENFIHCGEMATAEYYNGKDYRGSLTKEEKGIIESTINSFLGKQTEQIVALMHEEDAYKKTERGDIISYSFASSLKM